MKKLSKQQRAQLMATNYIKYLKYLIEGEKEKLKKLEQKVLEKQQDIYDLEQELKEKEGYQYLTDNGIAW